MEEAISDFFPHCTTWRFFFRHCLWIQITGLLSVPMLLNNKEEFLALINLIDSRQDGISCSIMNFGQFTSIRPSLASLSPVTRRGVSNNQPPTDAPRLALSALLAIYNGDQETVSSKSRQLSGCLFNWPCLRFDTWLVTTIGPCILTFNRPQWLDYQQILGQNQGKVQKMLININNRQLLVRQKDLLAACSNGSELTGRGVCQISITVYADCMVGPSKLLLC